MKLIDKLFYQEAYAVGIREKNGFSKCFFSQQGVFRLLMPTEKEWYADSFCFEENNTVYLFMEIMGRNEKKGTLGVSVFKQGIGFSEVEEILREPFHLSYPNVFKYKSNYYMIPETHQAGEIRLYEADTFPCKWHLKKILFTGGEYVDSSILKVNENEYIVFSLDITNNKEKLRLFKFNAEKLTFDPLEMEMSLFDKRPGGNPITYNGSVYRLLQDCSKFYGEKLLIYQLNNVVDSIEKWTEEYVGQISADMIHTDQKVLFSRIHTLTRSENYEAIDLLYKRFYITKPFNGVKRLCARKIKWGIK